MATQMASVARLELAAQERTQKQPPAQESAARVNAAAAYQAVDAVGDGSVLAGSGAAGSAGFAQSPDPLACPLAAISAIEKQAPAN
jgi:hypothetical protein